MHVGAERRVRTVTIDERAIEVRQTEELETEAARDAFARDPNAANLGVADHEPFGQTKLQRDARTDRHTRERGHENATSRDVARDADVLAACCARRRVDRDVGVERCARRRAAFLI